MKLYVLNIEASLARQPATLVFSSARLRAAYVKLKPLFGGYYFTDTELVSTINGKD